VSRTISATNLAEINAAHLHEVLLVKLAFDTPVYAHSGIGTITYDSNDYTGVGHFGAISAPTESEHLRPTSLTLSLSGVDSGLITNALNSGTYGDVVTIYLGYRTDDGTLVDDPFVMWKGTLDYSSIKHGAENVVSLTLQHDLAILNEADGSRFTDEDQQVRYSGDVGFQYVTDVAGVKLLWGGRPVSGSGGGSGRGAGDERPNNFDRDYA